jgi:hypothetical protein
MATEFLTTSTMTTIMMEFQITWITMTTAMVYPMIKRKIPMETEFPII